MPSNLYEILALAMRYWFALLGGLIVWRAFSWLGKDRRQTHKRLKQLPDAGMIGELVVLAGSNQLMEDCVIPVPYEGCLGFLRTCDVVVPVGGVLPEHLDFSFVSGKGLFVYPRKGCFCAVDGVEIVTRRDSHRTPMGHSSVLTVGDAVLRLRLFVGLDAPMHAQRRMDAPIWPEEQPWPQEGWQTHAPEGLYSPECHDPLYPPEEPLHLQGYAPPYPQQDMPPFPQRYDVPMEPPVSMPYAPPMEPYPPVKEQRGRMRRQERRRPQDGFSTPEGFIDRSGFDEYDRYR